MPRKLRFEDFRFNPSETEQQRHRVVIRQTRSTPPIFAPTTGDKAFIEELRKSLPHPEIVERKPLPRHDLQELVKRIPSPNPPRLRKHIFQLGSLYAVSIPEAVFPWIGWYDQTEEEGAQLIGDGSITAFFTGSNFDMVTLGAGAGSTGYYGEDNYDGGQSTGFAYQGQYFTAAAVSDSGVPLIPNEAWLAVSANPSISYWWNWSTYIGANAAVSLSACFLIQIYPPNNAPMQTLWGPQTYMYQRNQWTGGDDNSNGPLFFPISLSFPVNAGYNYGVFVQYIASAQGDGYSPGTWVPGSSAACGLTATLPAIQCQAVCNIL